MTPELVCIGLATRDTIVSLPHWPDPDGRLVVDRLRRGGGGPAATAAVAASRLGRSVAFVGAVGDDSAGDQVRGELAAAGVDVTHLLTVHGATAESVILLDRSAATRSILHAPAASLSSLSPAADALCATASWVHVDHAGWPLVRDLPGERVSVDAGNPIEDLDLAGVGLYAPSVSALQARYPGRDLHSAVRAALEEGVRRVVVTLGEGGAMAADRTGAWRVGPLAVEVVSTLGAGDVFHGALLAGLLEGLRLPEALRMANGAAALACRGLDGREAIPDLSELHAVLAAAPAVEPVLLDAGA